MINAIMVCVDYADILRYTLPYNRHHFGKVTVVTTQLDEATQKLARMNRADVVTTELFYHNGADFNKWRALEYGLDRMGREGWICVMDADVFWPLRLPPLDLRIGCLYTPLRHDLLQLQEPLPIPEDQWHNVPLHGNRNEWGGYTQLFHATDSHLPNPPPWYDVNWRHAGGADSLLQQRWPLTHKLRLPFNVLHVGQHGYNWCGRAAPFLDGTKPAYAAQRLAKLRGYLKGRRGKRLYGPGCFDHEKYDPST